MIPRAANQVFTTARELASLGWAFEFHASCLEIYNDEIRDLLDGKPPVREGLTEPSQPRASAVPPAGKSRPRPESPTGDIAPQPQA